MVYSLTEQDVGKSVTDRDGAELGEVSRVEAGSAFVDLNPGISESLLAKRGADEPEEDTFEFVFDQIEQVTDEEVQLV